MPFVCPDCGAVSHSPKDLEHRFCARCNKFFPGGEPVGPESPRQAQQLTETHSLEPTRVVLRVFECGDCRFRFAWIDNHTPNFCPVCSMSPVWEKGRDANASLTTLYTRAMLESGD